MSYGHATFVIAPKACDKDCDITSKQSNLAGVALVALLLHTILDRAQH